MATHVWVHRVVSGNFLASLFRLNRCPAAGAFMDLFMYDGSSVSNFSVYSYMDIFTFWTSGSMSGCSNVPGMLVAATYLPSLELMAHESNVANSDTVGELVSDFLVNYHCDLLSAFHMLRGIAYNSSTKGKCADTKKSKITENCEAGKWGSTNEHTTAIIDGREKDKKVSFDNVTEEG